MTHVVYNKDTTRLLSQKRYATGAAAKAAITRSAKNDCTMIKADYAVAESSDFHNNIEKQVTRINLMSKLEYQERVNTSISCSPASETYWSM